MNEHLILKNRLKEVRKEKKIIANGISRNGWSFP